MRRTRSKAARERIESMANILGNGPDRYNATLSSDEDEDEDDGITVSFSRVRAFVPASSGSVTDYDDDDDDDDRSFIPLQLDSRTITEPRTKKSRRHLVSAVDPRPDPMVPIIGEPQQTPGQPQQTPNLPRQTPRQTPGQPLAAAPGLPRQTPNLPRQGQVRRAQVPKIPIASETASRRDRKNNMLPVKNGEYIVFENRTIVPRTALSDQPWYQMAMAVSGASGVDVTQLVALPDIHRRSSIAGSPLPVSIGGSSPFGYGSVVPPTVYRPPILNRQPPNQQPPNQESSNQEPPNQEPQDDTDIIMQQRNDNLDIIFESGDDESPQETSPGPASTPMRPVVGSRTFPSRPASRNTSQTGALSEPLRAAYLGLEAEIQEYVGNDETDTQKWNEIRRRQQSLQILEQMERRNTVVQAEENPFDWLTQPWTSNRVPLTPRYAMSLATARDMVRMRFPGTLGQVTVEQFERSTTARTFFAMIAASLVNRSFFVRGRSPLRASDYPRYEESVAYALTALAFARIVNGGNSVEIEQQVLRSQRSEAASRTPWCTSSSRYASSSRIGGGGTSDFFGSVLKRGLLETPGFAPLTGYEAQRSPYAGRGVFL